MSLTSKSFSLLILASGSAFAGTPDVESFLHAGDLARGEQALEAALRDHPQDDNARFGLGAVRVLRAIERFGQSLHEYGVKPPGTRLPIAENPNPAPIDYRKFRRLLDQFRRDLVDAETTLAAIEDDDVHLALRLARIRVDFDGDGKATDEFLKLLENGFRQRDFSFLKHNPDFLVRFDRGDVSWLRGYCHLLCGILDGVLAFDGERDFNRTAKQWFANPILPEQVEEQPKIEDVRVRVVEPLRLARTRQHLVVVCELNRETWTHVRRETDDDHEWLPNPKQHGVLGLPVDDQMITAWLAMVDEVQATLEGKRAFLKMWIHRNDKGLDLKALLDDPPLEWGVRDEFPPDRYFTLDRDVNIFVVLAGFRAFGGSALGYAIWFN